jgi:hypothetical protein
VRSPRTGPEAFCAGLIGARRRRAGKVQQAGAQQAVTVALPGTVFVKAELREHPALKSLWDNKDIVPP